MFFGMGNYVFPYIIPRGFLPWKESAVWQVKLSASREIENIQVIPIVLDDDGLPARARHTQSRRILKSIHKYSNRIIMKNCLKWWRLYEMIRPIYIWLSIVHYADIGRRQGIWSLAQTIIAGMRSQLVKKEC